MKSQSEMNRLRPAITTVIALMTLGATPYAEKKTLVTVPISQIDRASVRIRSSKEEGTTEVSFVFANKSFQEVFKMFEGAKTPIVRVTSGSSVLAEAPLSFCFEDESKSPARAGMVLSFQSAEEAAIAARRLRGLQIKNIQINIPVDNESLYLFTRWEQVSETHL